MADVLLVRDPGGFLLSRHLLQLLGFRVEHELRDQDRIAQTKGDQLFGDSERVGYGLCSRLIAVTTGIDVLIPRRRVDR